VSPSTQHITGVTGGAPAYSILPDSADEQTRTRFEQTLEFARANHPGDPFVFRRSDRSDIEIEALPVSINGTGWLSVNLYQVSRTAVLQRLIAALRQRLHQLHGAASLHDVCTRVNTLLLPAGMGISVFEHRQPDALPVPLYATLPLDQVTFDQATLALIVQRRLPLFLHTITPETLDDIARATGVRGHIVLLLPETGDRQHILHLWGSSVAAEEQEQLEMIALRNISRANRSRWSAAWWGAPSAKASPWRLPTSKPSRTCTVRSGKPIGCALRCFSHCTIEGASSACSASRGACLRPSMMMTG
jgi:hypothetical protein